METVREMRQIPLAIGPDPRPGFDNYVAAANVAALEHFIALRPAAALTYLWGPSGSGKTHLLRAWVQSLQSAGCRAGWFHPGCNSPWLLQPDWAVVVIDDCDRLDETEQRAAFSLFNQAADGGIGFAAAGLVPPVDLKLREDLRSRLAWGHVFALQCLGEADARAAMRREADRRGLLLSEEVLAFVMRRFSRDMKSMMALLDAVDHYSLAQGRAVTVPLLRRMLADDAELEVASQ
jgi:DnaA-homolog protein